MKPFPGQQPQSLLDYVLSSKVAVVTARALQLFMAPAAFRDACP